eukprot:SAG31_NODE_67_length_28318_cov_6.493674_30_plen_88_part_00
MISLLQDYSALCKQQSVTPKKVVRGLLGSSSNGLLSRMLHPTQLFCLIESIRMQVLTFTPCGRKKTMDFIKWLGVPDSVVPSFVFHI